MRRERFHGRLMFILVGAMIWALTSFLSEVRAASGPDFSGKTVRVLVGFSPGGGHDLEVRIISRHIGKYLPGKPNVIVQNMPGASGLIMLTYLYNRTKPDGLTWGIAVTTPFLHTALGANVNFDLAKMRPVWSVG